MLTTKTNSNIIISYYRYIYYNTIYNIGTEERNSLDDFFFFFRFRHIKDVKYIDTYNNACSILGNYILQEIADFRTIIVRKVL